MSYVPVGTGQKANPPFEAATVSITTRSTPLESFCSSATIVVPPATACRVPPSMIVPLIEVAVDCVATSPACSTGLRRYLPFPCTTIDAQALKSMLRSFVSPAPMVNSPPAIWPDGILMPVLVSDDSCNCCGVLLGSLVSITQLAKFPHLLLLTVTLSAARKIRSCW